MIHSFSAMFALTGLFFSTSIAQLELTYPFAICVPQFSMSSMFFTSHIGLMDQLPFAKISSNW